MNGDRRWPILVEYARVVFPLWLKVFGFLMGCWYFGQLIAWILGIGR